MYRLPLPLSLSLALAAGLGCSAGLGDLPVQDVTDAPLIVRLQLRDGDLDVTGSYGEGVRYSFASESAESFAYLTLEELDLVAPELSELARSASARAAVGSPGSYLDASRGMLGIR